MRVLLDTHALLWWVTSDPRLSRRASQCIGSLDVDVFVSAVSAVEVTTKVRLGKLPGAEEFAADFTLNVDRLGFRRLPLTLEHGERAGSLAGAHRDPFDRMLMAQSIAEDMPLVSNEEIFDEYKVRRIW